MLYFDALLQVKSTKWGGVYVDLMSGDEMIRVQIEHPEPMIVRELACSTLYLHFLFSTQASPVKGHCGTGSLGAPLVPSSPVTSSAQRQLEFSSPPAHNTELQLSPCDPGPSPSSLSSNSSTSSPAQRQLVLSSSGHLQIQKAGQVKL